MVTFWLLAILLFTLAIAFILYPFIAKQYLGKKSTEDNNELTIDQRQINIDIAKEQLSALEIDFSAGEISQEEYDSLKYELEASLIDDISANKTPAVKSETTTTNHKIIILLVILFIPLCSVLFYYKLGTPGMIDGSAQQFVDSQHGKTGNQPSVEDMVVMLANKLKDNPGDQRGWFLLAKTYMALKKYNDAYKTYEKLLILTGEDPAVLVSMADSLAMTRGGKMSGEPEKLLRRALKISSDNVTALWLIGIAEKEKGNHAQALKYWSKLYPLISDDVEAKETVAKMIESVGGNVEANESEHNHDSSVSSETMASIAAEIQASTSGKEIKAIKVTVNLSAEILNQADSNDIVFIYAKALQGPPMPLAAYKKKVSELPITVILDDSMAMMPTMKISAFKQVLVGARISKSGQPGKQAGDLMSDEVTVDLNNIQPVKLTINTLVE